MWHLEVMHAVMGNKYIILPGLINYSQWMKVSRNSLNFEILKKKQINFTPRGIWIIILTLMYRFLVASPVYLQQITK